MTNIEAGQLAPGTIFQERYQIVRCLAAGGMGAVYEVLHLETRRRRALKVMLPSVAPNPELRARFKAEATVAADVQSEHIVETFDAGVDARTGTPFLVMELLQGEDLSAVLARRARLPPAEVLVLMRQVAMALDKTHAASIVHRDLKPENLFLTQRDDGAPRVKILDFGTAKVVAQHRGDGLTGSTRSIGTPLYMSPEQIKGDRSLGPRADLYALGHIVFTLLVGTPYWAPEMESSEGIFPFLVAVMSGITESATARARRLGVHLPERFDPWFARATALAPHQRFERASEMIVELDGLFHIEDLVPGTDARSVRSSSATVFAAPAFASQSAPAAIRLPASQQFAGPTTGPSVRATPARRDDTGGKRLGVIVLGVALVAAPIGILHVVNVRQTVFRPSTPSQGRMPIEIRTHPHATVVINDVQAKTDGDGVGTLELPIRDLPTGSFTLHAEVEYRNWGGTHNERISFEVTRAPVPAAARFTPVPGPGVSVPCRGQFCDGDVIVSPDGTIALNVLADPGTLVRLSGRETEVEAAPEVVTVSLAVELANANLRSLLSDPPDGFLELPVSVVSVDEQLAGGPLRISERALIASMIARMSSVSRGPVQLSSDDILRAGEKASLLWIHDGTVAGHLGTGERFSSYQLVALSASDTANSVSVYQRSSGAVVARKTFASLSDRAEVMTWLRAQM